MLAILKPHSASASRRKTSFLRVGLLLLAVAGSSACTTLGTTGSAPVDAPADLLPEAVQVFLSKAPAGSRIALADSPWGSDVSVEAHAPYYAASGRTCRELTIGLQGSQRPGLACRVSAGAWESVRVLHHGGRPVAATERRGAE